MTSIMSVEGVKVEDATVGSKVCVVGEIIGVSEVDGVGDEVGG